MTKNAISNEVRNLSARTNPHPFFDRFAELEILRGLDRDVLWVGHLIGVMIRSKHVYSSNSGNRFLLRTGGKRHPFARFPDGSHVGVNGLDALFEEACREGKAPDPAVAADMVARLSKRNYIPDSALSEYEEAVFKEYQRFVKAKERS